MKDFKIKDSGKRQQFETGAQRDIQKGKGWFHCISPFMLMRLAEETNAGGAVVARYAQGLNIDEPLAMMRNGVMAYYHADGLGSITSLTTGADPSYTYDSFGKLVASEGSITNPFRYTAREFDTETGFYFYRARYYNPADGRFLSEDPVRFDGGIHFYGYALNSPILFKDPLGLTATCYYAQNSGHLVCYDDGTKEQIVNTYGYAGGNKGNSPGCVNNSACQYRDSEGPLPWGAYNIGRDNQRISPFSLPLTPLPGTSLGGRTGPFYIHGDNKCACRSGSEGCIVVNRDARKAIDDAGGGKVLVSPTDPDLSSPLTCAGGLCKT